MSLRVLCLFLCFWSCYHVQSIAGLTNQGTSVSDELLRLKQSSLSTKSSSKSSDRCTSLDGPYCANFNGLEKPSFGASELSLFDFKLKDTVKVFDDLTLQLKQLMKALTVGLPVMNFDSFDSSELNSAAALPEKYSTGAPESVSFSWTGAWTVIRTPSDEPGVEGEAEEEEATSSADSRSKKKELSSILSSHTPQAPYITLVDDQARIKFSSELSLDRFYVKKLKTKNKVVIQGLHKSWPRWTRTLGKEEMDWMPITDGRGDLIDEIVIHAEPYALSMDNLQFRNEEQLSKVSSAEKKPKIDKIFMVTQKEDGFVMETIDGEEASSPILEQALDKLQLMYDRQQQTQHANKDKAGAAATKRLAGRGQYESAPNAVSDEEDDDVVAEEGADGSTVTSSAMKQPEKVQVKLTRETAESNQKVVHAAPANEDKQDPTLHSGLSSDQEDDLEDEEEDDEDDVYYIEENMFSPEVVEREIKGINERLQRDFGDRVQVKSFHIMDPTTGELDESSKDMQELLQQLFSQGGGGVEMEAAYVQYDDEDEDEGDEHEGEGEEDDGEREGEDVYDVPLGGNDSEGNVDSEGSLSNGNGHNGRRQRQQEEDVIEL
eukprot:GILJ01010780.1.p1 GENE.GILJ01010780.1~~GILJ01010780.1.p1  ORF type:complete len:604 (-),score=140.70 GILJ01010780.1:86-1897(-)